MDMLKKCLLIFVLCTAGLFSVFAQEKNIAIIGFYNLENLFDTIDDPRTNDAQFLPDGEYQWTTERYNIKQNNMAYAISQIAKEYGGLVALGVSEVENEGVLLDLVSRPALQPFNYGVVHHDSPDRRGVDVALLYQKDRFKVIYKRPYRLVTGDTAFRTRDQLLIQGVIDGTDTIHIIVNHWPSKIGGEKLSMPKRIAAAELSKHITDSIMLSNPAAKIVLMGDLNDNPNAKSIVHSLQPKTKAKDVSVNQLFNPMYKLYMEGIWSYVYRDEPNVIDQIIISYGLLNATQGFRYSGVRIFRANFLLNKTGTYEGTPFRTLAGGTFLGGYSDHLPVYIILEKNN
ncbi:MAG: endonuclease/exonuclease/phosphatase family protein [Bacteroidales bacterium]|nr:endonuclease/exonuclease/phosphatase family protein [Bacteroidales bacterium]